MKTWFKTRFPMRWHEVTSQLGAVLGVVSVGAQQFAAVNPTLAYVGIGASVCLLWFKEHPETVKGASDGTQ